MPRRPRAIYTSNMSIFRRGLANGAMLALILAAACPPGFSQGSPAARVGALLERSAGFSGDSLPAPTPVAPPAVVSVPAGPASAVVPAGLWASLDAPDAATGQWLAGRVPGLDASSVRVLTFAAADALFSAAVARNLTPLDFFTDPAFRAQGVFYLPQETVAALFARYEMHAITPASGTTTDDKPFVMEALLVGNGRIDMLYDQDDFSFRNAVLDNDRYTLAARVTERIEGPGDLTLEGVAVKYGILKPIIRRITKISPTEARVDTNFGSRNRPVLPIRRRD
jgi:hypothetical protein